MKLQIVLEPSDEGGFTAVVPALPGCISEGDTRDEALANIQEAVRLYLEPVDDDPTLSPDAEVIEIAKKTYLLLPCRASAFPELRPKPSADSK